MTKRGSMPLTLLLLALHGPALGAQTPAVRFGPLEEDDRVRVWAPVLSERPIVGRVVAADSSLLVLELDDGRRTLGWGQVDRLDRYAGRERAGPALTGAAVGAAVAFLGVKLYLDARDDYYGEWNDFTVLAAIPVGALAGAVVGAVVGAPDWEPVPIDLRLGAGTGGGAAVGVRWRF